MSCPLHILLKCATTLYPPHGLTSILLQFMLLKNGSSLSYAVMLTCQRKSWSLFSTHLSSVTLPPPVHDHFSWVVNHIIGGPLWVCDIKYWEEFARCCKRTQTSLKEFNPSPRLGIVGCSHHAHLGPTSVLILGQIEFRSAYDDYLLPAMADERKGARDQMKETNLLRFKMQRILQTKKRETNNYKVTPIAELVNASSISFPPLWLKAKTVNQ